MGKFLYTVVCKYYTRDGIIEVDLYEVFKRLRIKPYVETSIGNRWNHYAVVRHHVYTGQAVEYIIKKVYRDIRMSSEERFFYSEHPPYSLLYDCRLDSKDVEKMNQESIGIRLNMSEEQFKKIYGQGGPKK